MYSPRACRRLSRPPGETIGISKVSSRLSAASIQGLEEGWANTFRPSLGAAKRVRRLSYDSRVRFKHPEPPEMICAVNDSTVRAPENLPLPGARGPTLRNPTPRRRLRSTLNRLGFRPGSKIKNKDNGGPKRFPVSPTNGPHLEPARC